jgi:prophage antirepressor-like protein
VKEHENTGLSLLFGDKPVRTLIRDGVPWWVAKDVCDILGLGNVTEALRCLEEDEKTVLDQAEFQGSNLSLAEVRFRDLNIPNRGLNVINESGLYNLIFRSERGGF